MTSKTIHIWHSQLGSTSATNLIIYLLQIYCSLLTMYCDYARTVHLVVFASPLNTDRIYNNVLRKNELTHTHTHTHPTAMRYRMQRRACVHRQQQQQQHPIPSYPIRSDLGWVSLDACECGESTCFVYNNVIRFRGGCIRNGCAYAIPIPSSASNQLSSQLIKKIYCWQIQMRRRT